MGSAELLASILDAGPIGPEAMAGLSRQRRLRAEAGIAALIDYLDVIDVDADLEDDGCAEPSLGSLGSCSTAGSSDQSRWAWGGADDLEQEDEHGDDLDRGEDEHDGSEPDVDDEDGRDDEPSLGSLDRHLDQRRWSHGLLTDRELDEADDEEDGRRPHAPIGGAEPSELGEAEILAMDKPYALTCHGNCLEPLVQSGTKLVMDPAAPLVLADLVTFWRRCPDGTVRAYVKRLLFHPPGGLQGPELDACWLFEMLNPRTLLPVASRELIAVHAVIGTKKPCGRFDPALVERNAAFLRAEVAGARHGGAVQ